MYPYIFPGLDCIHAVSCQTFKSILLNLIFFDKLANYVYASAANYVQILVLEPAPEKFNLAPPPHPPCGHMFIGTK